MTPLTLRKSLCGPLRAALFLDFDQKRLSTAVYRERGTKEGATSMSPLMAPPPDTMTALGSPGTPTVPMGTPPDVAQVVRIDSGRPHRPPAEQTSQPR